MLQRVEAVPAQRAVPDVVGTTLAEASNLLGQAGFAVEPDRPSPRTPSTEGTVIGTDPAAGTPQPKGATITVVVSSGPAPVEVPMPPSSA